jgi:hypothetical protein
MEINLTDRSLLQQLHFNTNLEEDTQCISLYLYYHCGGEV